MSNRSRRSRKRAAPGGASRKALPRFTHDDVLSFLERVKIANEARRESERYPEVPIKALEPLSSSTKKPKKVLQLFQHDINRWLDEMDKRSSVGDRWYHTMPYGKYNPLVKINLEGSPPDFDMLYLDVRQPQSIFEMLGGSNDDDDGNGPAEEGVRERYKESDGKMETGFSYYLPVKTTLMTYYSSAYINVVLMNGGANEVVLFRLEPQSSVNELSDYSECDLLGHQRSTVARNYSIQQYHSHSWISIHIKYNAPR